MPLFETPGWSLSPALLKSQAEAPAEQNNGPSKKRKRKNKEPKQEQVNDNNIAEMWRQHVEGIKPTSSAQQKAQQPLDGNEARSQRTSKNLAGDEPQRKKQKSDKKIEKSSSTKAAETTRASPAKASADATQPVPPPPPPVKLEMKLTPLQAAMRQKLISARFRHLNETLYTTSSGQAQGLLEANPTFFEEYHSGFRQQVQTWPQNPVDGFVEDLKQRGKIKSFGRGGKGFGVQGQAGGDNAGDYATALPRTNNVCTVADLGCGDAKLANLVSGKLASKFKIKVVSYDLQSPNAHVIKADIANLPLEDGSIDIAIFCLALMGTNWTDFIEEAWRVLHWKGELWVAEIKSRFGKPSQRRVEHSVGNRRKKMTSKADTQKEKDNEERTTNEQLMVEVDGAEGKAGTDVSAFVEVLRKRGFALLSEHAVDMSNKMFVKMRFVEALTPTKGKNVKEGAGDRPGQKRQKTGFVDKPENDDVDESSVLKPCLYKIR